MARWTDQEDAAIWKLTDTSSGHPMLMDGWEVHIECDMFKEEHRSVAAIINRAHFLHNYYKRDRSAEIPVAELIHCHHFARPIPESERPLMLSPFANLDLMAADTLLGGTTTVHALLIGSGKFSRCIKVAWGQEGRGIVLKTVDFPSVEAAESVAREARALHHIGHHENIVRWRGALPQIFAFAMDYYPQGDLLEALSQDSHPLTTSPSNRARIFLNVAKALLHLKSKGVLHRDIRPENVLMKDGGGAVLAGFGHAYIVQGLAEGGGGAPRWPQNIFICAPFSVAPEVALKERQDFSSDIFCLGLLMAEVWMGRWQTMIRGHRTPYGPDYPDSRQVAHKIKSIEWHVWDLMKGVQYGECSKDWLFMEGAWVSMVVGRHQGRSKIEVVVMMLTEAVRKLEEDAQNQEK